MECPVTVYEDHNKEAADVEMERNKAVLDTAMEMKTLHLHKKKLKTSSYPQPLGEVDA